MTRDDQIRETARCFRSPAYFIGTYCQIYDAVTGEWVRFGLWPEQKHTLLTILNNLLVIILKARQLGLTWLVLGFALWLCIFRPAATVLLFSKRDDEAVYLLDDRLKGMWQRLPEFLRAGLDVLDDNDHVWTLSNGSSVRAFPTSAGDSYTATLAIVDEADLVPDLNRLMRAVKPTIDAGGRMILLSRSDKKRPLSEFKAIYRAAKAKLSPWIAIFLPWFARPGRTPEWYEEQKRDIQSRTGALDDLYEQYPATDAEALAPKSKDKRIPGEWLLACYEELKPAIRLSLEAPAIASLEIYKEPEPGIEYVIGADPAEGNPTSDDSALEVLERITGEEVAALAGKYQPSTFAAHIDAIGKFYNQAGVLCERNNHGHAVLLWLRDNSKLVRLKGRDKKEGWHSTTLGKSLMYDGAADAFRDGEAVLHSFETYTQLASVEGSTLLAPEGERDDRADGWTLANLARTMKVDTGEVSSAPARSVQARELLGS
jgi:hypothetical protein